MILRREDFLKYGYFRTIFRTLRILFLNKLKTIFKKNKFLELSSKVKLKGYPVLLNDRQGQVLCDGCGICVKYCPNDAINVVTSSKKLKSFQLNQLKCDVCDLCIEACPLSALECSGEVSLADHIERSFIYQPLGPR